MRKRVKKLKRERWLDLIKVIACFLVVTLHTVRDGLDEGRNNIGLILFDLGVFAIPLFFMVNGYLQLRKEKVSYKYCFKKIIRIFIIVLIVLMIVIIPKILNIHFVDYDTILLEESNFNAQWVRPLIFGF